MALIKRGQIWWVDFGEPHGSEPGYMHPALVVQRDEVNASQLATVVVCVLTSNVRFASAPGNTLLSKKHTKLPRDSVVNASQIATVDRDDLAKLVGTLPKHVLDTVDDGLRWFLHLETTV